MSLAPVPSEPAGASCAHCGAALVADQRYCLSCGKPASPVRLAFLDVLQSDRAAAAAPPTLAMTPAGYAPIGDGVSDPGARGANGWLRRNTGLLALLGVLVLCLIAGLLVGHWVSQGNKAPAKQVVEVKGLSGLAAASAAPAATTGAPPAAPAATSTPSSSGAKQAAKEAAEAKRSEEKESKVEKAPPPAPKKVAPTTIKKLSNSTGAQHTKEINELGATPIETG